MKADNMEVTLTNNEDIPHDDEEIEKHLDLYQYYDVMNTSIYKKKKRNG